MRNKIVVNEPDQKRYITQFVPGEMFTYAGSDKSDNVYMKLAHSEVDEAVLLTTGARFPINREALLSPVSSITISKNK